jgi:hypothetical protein
MPLVRLENSASNVYQFYLHFEKNEKKSKFSLNSLFLFFSTFRFDEVDEANPDNKPAVHNVVLEGKRKPKLPFEDELRPPCGKLTNDFCFLLFVKNFSMFFFFNLFLFA